MSQFIKKNNIEAINHGKVTETYVAEIFYFEIYCGNCICLKTSINKFF